MLTKVFASTRITPYIDVGCRYNPLTNKFVFWVNNDLLSREYTLFYVSVGHR